MNKITKLFALLLIAGIALTSCGRDDDNIVVADRETLNQTVYADEVVGASGIRFTTTGAWTAAVSANWVSVSHESGGAGTHTITISLAPNTTGADRTATITITSGGEETIITITQRGVREDGSVHAGRLPSRIVITEDDEWEEIWTFEYDEQNRMTKFGGGRVSTIRIEYDANNRISKIIFDEDEIVFQYVGNQIVITDDWGEGEIEIMRITLNANGQIIRMESGGYYLTFTYTDGSLTQIRMGDDVIDYTYSDVLNVFRYVTSPDWLIMFLGLSGGHNFSTFFPPSRNMPSKITTSSHWRNGEQTFTYQTDTEGFVTSSRIIETWQELDDYAASVSKSASSVFRPFGNFRFAPRSRASTRSNTSEGTMTFEYIPTK